MYRYYTWNYLIFFCHDRAEAKLLFFAENPDLYRAIDQRPDDSLNVPLPSYVNEAPNNQPAGQSTPIARSSDGNSSRNDPILNISQAMPEHNLTARLKALNSLLDLNQTKSSLIKSLQNSRAFVIGENFEDSLFFQVR